MTAGAWSMRCPRCKLPLAASDAQMLADQVLVHLKVAHDHAPPREHVVARIARLHPTAAPEQ